jgi:hypothetical protein
VNLVVVVVVVSSSSSSFLTEKSVTPLPLFCDEALSLD